MSSPQRKIASPNRGKRCEKNQTNSIAKTLDRWSGEMNTEQIEAVKQEQAVVEQRRASMPGAFSYTANNGTPMKRNSTVSQLLAKFETQTSNEEEQQIMPSPRLSITSSERSVGKLENLSFISSRVSRKGSKEGKKLRKKKSRSKSRTSLDLDELNSRSEIVEEKKKIELPKIEEKNEETRVSREMIMLQYKIDNNMVNTDCVRISCKDVEEQYGLNNSKNHIKKSTVEPVTPTSRKMSFNVFNWFRRQYPKPVFMN